MKLGFPVTSLYPQRRDDLYKDDIYGHDDQVEGKTHALAGEIHRIVIRCSLDQSSEFFRSLDRKGKSGPVGLTFNRGSEKDSRCSVYGRSGFDSESFVRNRIPGNRTEGTNCFRPDSTGTASP